MNTVYADSFSDLSRLRQFEDASKAQAANAALSRLLGAFQAREQRQVDERKYQDQLRDREDYMKFLREDLKYKQEREDDIARRQLAEDERRRAEILEGERTEAIRANEAAKANADQLNAALGLILQRSQEALAKPDQADSRLAGQAPWWSALLRNPNRPQDEHGGPWSNPLNWLKNINPIRRLLELRTDSGAYNQAATEAEAIRAERDRLLGQPLSPDSGVQVDPRLRRFIPQQVMVPVTPGPDGGVSTRISRSPQELEQLAMQAARAIANGANPEAVRARFRELTGVDLP